jgi:transposase-like protein
VVKARIDRKATPISLLAAIGVRRDGQKILLAVRNMGGESRAAWRAFLDDLETRGLKAPAFIIVDGAPGLEAALAELWPDAPVQRCTVGLLKNSVPGRIRPEEPCVRVRSGHFDHQEHQRPLWLAEERCAGRKWR